MGSRSGLDEWRQAEQPLAPFHWEIEFPEAFERANPGFDAIVGNPPFQGGRKLSSTQGEIYSKWLVTLHPDASGGADLVAHFFRRAFDLLREDGNFGLIATNTFAIRGCSVKAATACRRMLAPSSGKYCLGSEPPNRLPWPAATTSA